MLDGRPEDVVSTAEACSRICELAGLDHRVADIEPSDDPELAEVFGPTLVAIAAKAAKGRAAVRGACPESKTYKRLGYDPISLDEGLLGPREWLRELGGGGSLRRRPSPAKGMLGPPREGPRRERSVVLRSAP